MFNHDDPIKELSITFVTKPSNKGREVTITIMKGLGLNSP